MAQSPATTGNNGRPTPPNPTPVGANGEQQLKKRKRRNKKRKKANNSAAGVQPGIGQSAQARPAEATRRPVQQATAQRNAPLQSNRSNTTRNQPSIATAPVKVPKQWFPKFNELPVNLQKEIFQLACSPRNARKWMLISRRVKDWVEPMICDSIKLPWALPWGRYSGSRDDSEKQKSKFHSNPKEFTKHVKRIFTGFNSEYDDSTFEIELLRTCNDLIILECWSDPREELIEILKTKSWPKLKVLCLNIDLLPKDENTFRFPLFQHVTHLEIMSEQTRLQSWKSLESLSNLTHMRVDLLVSLEDEDDRDVARAAEEIYATASEAQKYFPPILKFFVILLSKNLLYHVSANHYSAAEHEERWQRLESVRIGTFDPRIMLGSTQSWVQWDEDAPYEIEESEAIDMRQSYSRLVVDCGSYTVFPKGRHIDPEDGGNKWGIIEAKVDSRRKRYLAGEGIKEEETDGGEY